MSQIASFLADCERVAERKGWKRSTLSTLIFNDGKRLGRLAEGKSDIGVQRLELAQAQLAEIEATAQKSPKAA